MLHFFSSAVEYSSGACRIPSLILEFGRVDFLLLFLAGVVLFSLVFISAIRVLVIITFGLCSASYFVPNMFFKHCFPLRGECTLFDHTSKCASSPFSVLSDPRPFFIANSYLIYFSPLHEVALQRFFAMHGKFISRGLCKLGTGVRASYSIRSAFAIFS